MKTLNKRPNYETYDVRNRITGEVYQTSSAFPRTMIEGVEFTAVTYGNKLLRPVPKWIRSDSLVRVPKSLISKKNK